MKRNTLVNAVVFLGDVGLFYTALLVALFVRGREPLLEQVSIHILPFTFLLAGWLFVFFVQDFYSRHRRRVDARFFSVFFVSMAVNGAFSVGFFYLSAGYFTISPKTLLLLHFLTFMLLFVGWRLLVQRLLSDRNLQTAVLFVHPRPQTIALIHRLHQGYLGPYRVVGVVSSADHTFPDGIDVYEARTLAPDMLSHGEVEMIVVERHGSGYDVFHPETMASVQVLDAITFWERVLENIPVEWADASWFVGRFYYTRKRAYTFIKRTVDIVAALILLAGLWWFMLLLALVVKGTSPGPVFFRQERVGKQGRVFTVLKFRTMIPGADADGPAWAKKHDRRVTPVGRFLRHTHVDELPQLWNIVRGEMSFVGPRPEQPAFVHKLKEEVPFYHLRHLVKPGLTGWAQINYRYGRSTRDAVKKLAYDLYYVKHRSVLFDANILVKTVGFLFWGEKNKSV